MSHAQATDDRMKFRIGFDSPDGYHRQLLLTVDDRSTFGADWGFDGANLDNFDNDMSWLIEDAEYIIQGIPSIDASTALPLSIRIQDRGIITIGIDSLENVPNDVELLLIDSTSGTTHDLRSEGIQMDLDIGTYDNRFTLVIPDELTLSNTDFEHNSEVDVVYSKHQKTLKLFNNTGTAIENVQVYNIAGQEVKTQKVDPSVSLDISVDNLTSGAYILRAKGDNRMFTKKFVIN